MAKLEAMDLLAEYSISDMFCENEWTQGITLVCLKSSALDNPKELTVYPTLFLLKGSERKLRSNNENVNSMSWIDITDKGIVVRYGEVSFYRKSNNASDEGHIIGVNLEDEKSYLFVDVNKVINRGRIDYIQDLQQLIFMSDKPCGLEYFATY